MSSFVTLPTRLAAQWGASAAPAESLHVSIAVSGVTDPGGAKCKINQDTFFTHCDAANGAMVIGVFDGHGKEAGRDAAFAARDYFKAHFQSMTQQDYQQMEQRPQQAFSSMFNGCHNAMKSVLKAVYERRGFTVQEQDGYMVKLPTGIEATQQQQLYSCVRGGTTATIVVVLDGGRKILTANVGDSTVAIGAKRAVCMKQSDLLELHDDVTGPEATDQSHTTIAKLKTSKMSGMAKLLMLTGDHSPDNQREFFRARDFRRSESDRNMPGLRFLFDTSDPRMKRKPIFQVDHKGELTQKHTGDYLKNVRDEWATLVATPADSPFPDSLAFTRSLGDFHMHAYGVSCEPNVRELSLEQIAQRVLLHGGSRGNQDEEDDDEEIAASASNTESDDNNSETSMHDCHSHGGALEFTLVAASDGVWDNWKFHDLFEFLDNSDAKRTRARSTSSSTSTKSDAAGGNDEAAEAYPVDNAVAMLLKANLKLAQRIFGDDADNMTAVLCHFRVSS